MQNLVFLHAWQTTFLLTQFKHELQASIQVAVLTATCSEAESLI